MVEEKSKGEQRRTGGGWECDRRQTWRLPSGAATGAKGGRGSTSEWGGRRVAVAGVTGPILAQSAEVESQSRPN